MFDISKTINLIRGGLMEPQSTWEKYLGENPDIKTTFIQLTAPLIVLNVVLSILLSRAVGGFSAYGLGFGWFMALVMGLIMMLISIAIATAAFTLLAGPFGGRVDWQRGFTAVSLAWIPPTIGSIIGALIPWVGFLVYLAGVILGFVFLYRLMPLALDIPENKRPVHFVVALVCVIIINIIVGSILGLGAAANRFSHEYASSEYSSSSDSGRGMFSELERQGELIDAAESDRYDPPSDGKLSEDQVEQFVTVLKKSRQLQQREEERLEKLAEEMENKDNPSIGDLGRVFQGVGSAIGAHNAEMEVVKTAGGNWAEHEWVREQLRIAVVQQDGTPAIEHNYALYQKYADELDEAI